jgi:hypothetical protein
MVIEYKEEELKRVVYGIGFYKSDSDIGLWVQLNEDYEDTSPCETLCLLSFKNIIDPTIPSDWGWDIIDPTIPPDWVLEASELGYELHPKNLTFDMLEEAQDNTNYEALIAMNEVRAFHNFPLMDIPYELCPDDEKWRRLEKAKRQEMEDQLDEYLRIGEEIIAEKQKGQ